MIRNQEYDNIQAALGGIGGGLLMDMKEILEKSDADEATKALVNDSVKAVADALNALSAEVSRLARII